MYFLQVSDTHFLQDYEKNPDLFHDSFLKLTSPLEKLSEISTIIEKSVDFICHCGDISHAGQEEDYQKVKDCLSKLFPEVPLIVTAGNHDNNSVLQQVFYGKKRDFFADDTTIGNLRILSFDNTNGRPNSGEITEETCQWLLKKLEEKPEQNTILMCHHHCIPTQCGMPSAKIHPLFSEVLEKNNVIAVLTGHTHQNFVGEIEGVPYYTVGPLSFVGQDLGEGKLNVYEAGGCNLFSYENGHLKLETKIELGYKDLLGVAQKPSS